MPHATRDPWIVEALANGEVTADPDTGIVYYNGAIRCTFNNGYVTTYLGRGRYAFAHRVIWIAVNGEPDDKALQINHRNSVRSDNRIENLELVTSGENAAHAHGTAFYTRIRPDDERAVDPEWYAKVRALASRGDVTAEEIAALRGIELEDNPQTPRWLYKRPGRFSGCRAS